jgi:hypothetical protein
MLIKGKLVMISMFLMGLNVMLLSPEMPHHVRVIAETPPSETIVASSYYNRYGRCRRCARGSGRREILAISDAPQSPLALPELDSLTSDKVTPNSLSWY